MVRHIATIFASLALLCFYLPTASYAQTVLKDCPCSFTYHPQRSYEGAGDTEAKAENNAWSSFAADVMVGFKPWYEGLKDAAPKCEGERCAPRKVDGPGPLTMNQDVQSMGTATAPDYKATLTFQTTMTVTCGEVLPHKVWF